MEKCKKIAEPQDLEQVLEGGRGGCCDSRGKVKDDKGLDQGKTLASAYLGGDGS